MQPKSYKYYLEPKKDTLVLRHRISKEEKEQAAKSANRDAAAKHSRMVVVTDLQTLKKTAELKSQ